MKNKWLWIIVGAMLVANVLCIGTLAWLRIRIARRFTEPCHVHTDGGTNYVVQLLKTTVGRTDNGCVVIVYLGLRNPNLYEVTLKRESFVLMDHEKKYFKPMIPGEIRIPAGGLVEQEAFSFAVPDEALAGMITLEVGQNHFAMVKSSRSFTRQLSKGQFLMFRQPDW